MTKKIKIDVHNPPKKVKQMYTSLLIKLNKGMPQASGILLNSRIKW